jgi:hypothetical protein
MTEQNPDEEGSGRGRKKARFYRTTLSSYRAGLKLISPLFPIMAVVLTALTYIILIQSPDRDIVFSGLSINEGGPRIVRWPDSCLRRMGCSLYSCSQASYRKRI